MSKNRYIHYGGCFFAFAAFFLSAGAQPTIIKAKGDAATLQIPCKSHYESTPSKAATYREMDYMKTSSATSGPTKNSYNTIIPPLAGLEHTTSHTPKNQLTPTQAQTSFKYYIDIIDGDPNIIKTCSETVLSERDSAARIFSSWALPIIMVMAIGGLSNIRHRAFFLAAFKSLLRKHPKSRI